jgi:molecular chaperone GrpE
VIEEPKEPKGSDEEIATSEEENRLELPSMEVELEDARQEAREYRDKYLRALAELENQKKRVKREWEKHTQYANERLIYDILPILDNFERGIEASKLSHDFEGLAEGVEIIYRQLQELLEKEGVRQFESLGEVFDPHKHDAVLTIESDEHPPDTIIDEIERGYVMGDKVLRPARVSVSRERSNSGNEHVDETDGQGDSDNS